jgi:hypothetical protein
MARNCATPAISGSKVKRYLISRFESEISSVG